MVEIVPAWFPKNILPSDAMWSLSLPSVVSFMWPLLPVSIVSTSVLPSNILSDTIPVKLEPSP